MFKLFLYTHLFCAFMSFVLLSIKGRLQITGRDWRIHPILRFLPHLSDSLLIISGIVLLYLTHTHFSWWILIKLGLVVEYIIFATYFFHKKPTKNNNAFFLALICLSGAVLLGYYH